ncbi:thioredoxin-like protein [Marasmius fiardii PR-910]|nr:thioredoxin-like protein [Marasmius fiardii PR-910]
MVFPSHLKPSLRTLQLATKTTKFHQSSRITIPFTSKRSFTASQKRRDYYPDASFGTFKELTAGEKSKGRLVLVDFYAGWCRPCHMLSPVLKGIATDPNIKSASGLPVDVVTIDTETGEGYELGQRYKVRALPTVIAFREGKDVLQFVGALPESGVKDFLQKL